MKEVWQNPREVYGRTLAEMGRINENVVALEADLGKSTMSCYFEEEFPDRFFEMGIAEQNMVSFAAGLSLTGKIPFVNTFAVFAVGRAYEQIRVSVAIGNFNVRVVGSSAGLSDSGDGATHQSIEDCAIMSAIPNMAVLIPCDANEVKEMVKFACTYKGPIYLRIPRNDMLNILPEGYKYEFGKPVVIRAGSDVVVFAHGSMVHQALIAAEQLEKESISVEVINVNTLKPFDQEQIKQLAKGKKLVITAEEHSVQGGLSAAVAFALRNESIKMEAIAVPDVFGQSAENQDILMEHFGLTSENIITSIKKLINHEK